MRLISHKKKKKRKKIKKKNQKTSLGVWFMFKSLSSMEMVALEKKIVLLTNEIFK